jgi:hypothetical protein
MLYEQLSGKGRATYSQQKKPSSSMGAAEMECAIFKRSENKFVVSGKLTVTPERVSPEDGHKGTDSQKNPFL